MFKISALVLSLICSTSVMAQQGAQIIELWGSSPEPKLTANSTQQFFNILSTDGGGLRGIIPLYTIQYLENQTYAYALEKGYIPENDAQKLYMTQFFDILAGTSIGGLISAILTAPNSTCPDNIAHPMYSSDKAIELMTTEGNIIF